MTVITLLPYPHLGFIPLHRNSSTLQYSTQRLQISHSGFQKKITVVKANSGMVIDKEQEFKPSFDEYLKVMETVQIRREKRKISTEQEQLPFGEINEEIIEKVETLGLDEGKKKWVRKKLDFKDTQVGVKGKVQEFDVSSVSDVSNLKKDEVVKKWVRNESDFKDTQVGVRGRIQDFDVSSDLGVSNLKKDEVKKKWVRNELDMKETKVGVRGRFQDFDVNFVSDMLNLKKDDAVVKKWVRKKSASDTREGQMDSYRFREVEGKDSKFQEQGFRSYEKGYGRNENYSVNIERVAKLKKLSRKSDYDSDDNVEIERAAFKSLEKFPDVCDQPRVSRVDMEERIQKLAKCLNGAPIDNPEWSFSKMMRSAKIRFADFSIIRLIQILGNYGNWRQVLQVIEWMQARERFKSNRIRNIYTTALDALGKARRPVEALNLFHTMQQQMPTYPDRVAYHCIAITLGQAGHMRELFHVIDTMKSPPKKKLSSGVLQKWDPRLEPDTIVYNAVLNACVRQKNLEGAFWVLQQLREQGQKPNSITYGLVMEVMLACEKYNLVHEFFKKMQKSFIPNPLTYKVLVNTLWKEGKVDEAILAVQEMEKRGIVGSAAVYYDLARCLCSAGRCKEALVQIEKVCKVANKPLVVTYTGLIQASLDSGIIESGIYIFNHMCKFCSPNLVTYNIMLKGYLDHHKFDEARQLFHKLLENGKHVTNKVDYRQVVLPDIHTFNLMLDACLVNERWDDFEFVYTRMLQHGFYFNAKRHSHMIIEACKAGKVNLLDTTWKHLIEGDQIPPPPLVQEMFCMKLKQDDYTDAFSCLICLPSTESHKYSWKSWLNRFKENPDLFQEERLLHLIDRTNTLLDRYEEPNFILLNLLKSCKEILGIQ
uniref:pentatricopeptide repeat-containing protein At1g30610, chloroplastic n=1 Tax=Erigeron canadensis TaxID=72917 RepID=UPI001CB8BA18|nr:pentatricopeptide repeat-containing protein At1g30610, chloroplastic [Erigeron canadensis]